MFYFFCLFFTYYLCEKHYKPIRVQYYIAHYVSWVPRLTLLDLKTNWTYKRALGMELVCMVRGDILYSAFLSSVSLTNY